MSLQVATGCRVAYAIAIVLNVKELLATTVQGDKL